jgi:epoxyqueuosine reductase QueG
MKILITRKYGNRFFLTQTVTKEKQEGSENYSN